MIFRKPIIAGLSLALLAATAFQGSASGQIFGKKKTKDEPLGKKLTPESRLNTDYDFFETLHRAGRRAGRRFLDRHFDDIGVKSTIDLREEMRAEKEEAMPEGLDRLSK